MIKIEIIGDVIIPKSAVAAPLFPRNLQPTKAEMLAAMIPGIL